MTFQIMDPKRRDKLVIMMDILSIATKGAPKTRIMIKANLSYSQLNEYISFLINHGLLEETLINGKVVYKPTVKGMEFIEKEQDVLCMVSEVDQKTPFLVCSDGGNKFILSNLNSQ